jgi:acetyl/propionyl-CoA carboxylase alpha subunit/acetyl-CoA carboxylase carboxyltransferase component
MGVSLSRIAVVNRGESAMRLINAVRELRHAESSDLRTIALYTRAERTAMFVREADEAVCIDEGRPPDAGIAYLDLAVLERALVEARADAAWVGWGFVAERPEFAELCARLGVKFIGPRPEVMRRLGDKIGAKRLAEQADVPVAPWSGGPVETVDEARHHAREIGFPLMIKATSGGGGRGIRRVEHEDQLEEAFESARAEGLKAFGDATVFMERVVEGARHVEVQVIADEHGTVWAVGVRDCSLQRRNQKVIEESHSTALTPEQDRELRAAAVRLAAAAGYENAGTVEFLYQPSIRQAAFLEVNTRLQVEHPVTELTTGLDLVKLQIHVAGGGKLIGEPPPPEGIAIEARVNAEDPQRAFAPAPGTVRTLALPVGPGIRVDTGVSEGDVIPPEFDSMIAKVISFGRDREEAFGRLHRALSQMTVLVEGGTTNKSFLLDLIDRPEVRAGEFDTAWLDRLTSADGHIPTRNADVGLVAAALDASDLLGDLARQRFLGWASRGRPQVDAEVGHVVDLRHGGQSYKVTVRQIGTSRYEVELGGVAIVADVERLGRARSRLTIGGHRFAVVSSIQGSDHLVEIDGVAHRYSRDDAGIVRAPAAALVVGVDVAVDDVVEAGDRVAVVEAMKMEIAITAPVSGRIRDVFVARNVQVDAGAPLVRVEPQGDEDGAGSPVAAHIDLTDLRAAESTDPVERARDRLRRVRAYVLGFDVDGRAARRLLDTHRRERAALGPSDEIDAAELAVLDAFADLCALAPERRDPDAEQSGETRGPREHLNTYLRSLDVEREGLPSWYGDRLQRAVAHYGVSSLDRSPELETALLRIFLSQQRRADEVSLVMAMIDGLTATSAGDRRAAGLRETLHQLIEATQRRHPEIAALARGVRFRVFDQEHIDRASRATKETMKRLLAELVDPNATRNDDHVDQLVACPLPLVPIVAETHALRDAASAGVLLEVLTRRYYKIRALEAMRVEVIEGDEVFRAEYQRQGRTEHVVAVHAVDDGMERALLVAAEALAGVAPPDTAVVDVYLALGTGREHSDESLSADTLQLLVKAQLPDAVRRVALVAGYSEAGHPSHQLSFRRAGHYGNRPDWLAAPPLDATEALEIGSFEEDLKFRGLHPLIARRLQMWRLSNFDISRLPSPTDTHLFLCTAHDSPSDERLIAVAEVRDLTPLHDESGRVIALPEVENILVGCLDSIRTARAEQPRLRRLEWNRIMLYVWPVIGLTLDELTDIGRRLAPLTEGLGLELVDVSGRFAPPESGEPREAVIRMGFEPGRGLTVRITDPPTAPLQPLDDYTRKLIQTRRRGLVYPYELVPMLAGVEGTFVEYDLDESGELSPVVRPAGANRSSFVVGVVSTPTERHPEGMARVAVLGDPTKAMGAITEAECRRVIAALDLAEEMRVPIEWFALSAGAKIAMDSGSENLDWVARVLRRLVEHTQRGGEINIVVAGINVGAQPYWNAESTMLMHTRGILVMTPDSAMVLTGKQAIDYSGGVSAEDNLGIGGYDRIMGPNGEAQFWAPSLAAACQILFRHYELTYRAPGERWPRRAVTTDPLDREVGLSPHRVDGVDFTAVGDIFSAATNPDRKKPFDIRTLMDATVDQDHEPLERWPEMAEAEMAVVYEARLGGWAVTMIGVESRPLPRHGLTPADGPGQWSAGTLFPLSSKKLARAINAASGSQPVVVLANLSGFDGSPESLRRLQLEYGAEIGRAIVNFDGPIVLCVVSRYHGGAFVVFSATLNDNMEVLAVEGSFASVIGGAPAAAVVFTRDVDDRTRGDERVRSLEAAVASASGDEVARRQAELAETRDAVRTEKLGEVAAEFDAIHSVHRAQAVGSVHRIIAAPDLRAELIAAVERGMSGFAGS